MWNSQKYAKLQEATSPISVEKQYCEISGEIYIYIYMQSMFFEQACNANDIVYRDARDKSINKDRCVRVLNLCNMW